VPAGFAAIARFPLPKKKTVCSLRLVVWPVKTPALAVASHRIEQGVSSLPSQNLSFGHCSVQYCPKVVQLFNVPFNIIFRSVPSPGWPHNHHLQCIFVSVLGANSPGRLISSFIESICYIKWRAERTELSVSCHFPCFRSRHCPPRVVPSICVAGATLCIVSCVCLSSYSLAVLRPALKATNTYWACPCICVLAFRHVVPSQLFGGSRCSSNGHGPHYLKWPWVKSLPFVP
jgi:hypothetical protein